MARARYKLDPVGLHRYLRESPELKRVLLARAQLGVKIAKALAPVGVDSPRPGEFRDSIHAIANEVKDAAHLGGGVWVQGPISGARIVANSRDAVWAEFGRTQTNPYEGSHALGRTAKYLDTPKRGL